MRKFHIFTANMIFVLHCLVGLLIAFGWIFPKIKTAYLTLIISWFLCWVVLGYCPITKWEFAIRRKYDKSIDKDVEVIGYYARKFFGKNISSRAIFIGGMAIFAVLIVLTLFVV